MEAKVAVLRQGTSLGKPVLPLQAREHHQLSIAWEQREDCRAYEL